MTTITHYSPFDLLPTDEPRSVEPDENYFYDNVAKHLVKDVVRIMLNGIPIDLEKVQALEAELDTVLTNVDIAIQTNPIIREFQLSQHTFLKLDYIEEQRSKMKPNTHFIKPFDYSSMDHRSYFMWAFAQDHNIAPPIELTATGIPKWTAADVRRLPIADYPALQLYQSKSLTTNNRYLRAAMEKLAEDKAAIYNRRYLDNIANVDDMPLPPFNLSSPLQKQRLFAHLGIDSEATSKTTGLPSWDRDQIERINKETIDDDLRSLTQAFIDHSFGAIVKNNFIKAFYASTISSEYGDRLHGFLKLFGAKSFRLTSQEPNLLNMPSTKSIYSKPIKRCFIAPPGTVILTADYGALEDRVIASLTNDKNKCAVFLDGLDGHCLNAYGYFKDEVAKYMPITGNVTTDVREFYRLVEEGHKELKVIRQKGKPATFGLSYGAYPDKVSKTLKISIAAATAIFNSYHNELYSGITDYRENYVLPTAKANGRIHLGLGCYIYTDNARRDIRTLNNATCQFWSILTLLTINKMHQLIDDNNLADDVQCISTIYDSIYFIVKDDPTIIKWVNDNLIRIMTTDFIHKQRIKNTAVAEIGYDWATLTQIPNNASLEEVTQILGIVNKSKSH